MLSRNGSLDTFSLLANTLSSNFRFSLLVVIDRHKIASTLRYVFFFPFSSETEILELYKIEYAVGTSSKAIRAADRIGHFFYLSVTKNILNHLRLHRGIDRQFLFVDDFQEKYVLDDKSTN